MNSNCLCKAAGRGWGQEEKGTTEDEMAGRHRWLNGRESEWTLGVGDGQGGLACCASWGCKESDTTEWLNWTELSALQCYVSFYCPEEWISHTYTCILSLLDLFPLKSKKKWFGLYLASVWLELPKKPCHNLRLMLCSAVALPHLSVAVEVHLMWEGLSTFPEVCKAD